MKTAYSDPGTLPETARELSAAGDSPAPHTKRFTVDGDAALEDRLKTICDWVRSGLIQRLPAPTLEAIVLGGGYGRGEGGVLQTAGADLPYNDMEFYVYLRGNRLLNDLRYRQVMEELEHELSSKAGIEVEFKLQSLAATRRAGISMFSYDLVMGHRVVLGKDALFEHCDHHREGPAIPLAELTRLLMNRCSGLLFAKQLLELPGFSSDDADFVARNLAKLRLAMGDVVLGVFGHYHWSCPERWRRLKNVPPETCEEWLDSVQHEYRKGLNFKLHPTRTIASHRELYADLRGMSELSGKVWLWLEAIRLRQRFAHHTDYALAKENKCPPNQILRNLLINLRQFGLAGILSRSCFRYPRERMLCTLPILLWGESKSFSDSIQQHLQSQLCIGKFKCLGIVTAYECLWRRFR